ncbi:hypothetical protein ROSMUCSMR3_00303 [Roseovarius mucosus]|uniref:Methyltransferase type 11 domain-containing protein n=2 Tax=Roseovarius mucosus TaxID=215743 RepID=A0A1V0RJ43_9RHOB|nr:hypothetical protein ROSMUCSMR3_00303 [Roseovarius mucosus]
MPENEFQGLCAICGHVGVFRRGDHRSLRESYPCPNCRFTMRWRDQAAVILDEFGRGQALSIDELVARGFLSNVAVYEPALRGPFVARFNTLPHYTRSYFRPDLAIGALAPDGVRNENLTKLTFDEDSFDLIITSDVMEHLPDVESAFAETLRVLRPGGIHVFTIPNDYPFPDRTEPRVRVEEGAEVHLKPERYHNAGDGTKCLVYTDYGADLADMIRSLGGRLTITRRGGPVEPLNTNATFILRKIASAGRRRPVSSLSGADKPVAEVKSVQGAPTIRTVDEDLCCPICHGTEFEDFNGRSHARCSSCRGVERNRLMWMVLDRLGAFEKGKRILHLAPELGLARKFVELSGDAYHGADLDAERYKSKFLTVRKLDLCVDLAGIPDASYDLIVHSHVLEHLPCSVDGVLQDLDRILAPGGLHFLSVPVRGEHTLEDLSPDLRPVDRLTRFGQEDHMRIFGAVDLQALLTKVWGPGQHLIVPVELFARDDLRRAVIPTVAWQGVSGHSIFHYRKGARPPAEMLTTQVDAAPPSDVGRSLAPNVASWPQGAKPKTQEADLAANAPTGSRVILGLDALQRANPWPEFPLDEHAAFHLARDADGDGGREIILRQILNRDIRLMAEVGCFLGGSLLHWLKAKPDLTVIGIDPWDGDWASFVEGMAPHANHLSDAEITRIARLLRKYGNFAVALNALRLFKDRFVPVGCASPEALHDLRRRDIPIELIYLDGFKNRDELDVAHDLFPDAVLCGDNWLWQDQTGAFVVQHSITAFAQDHGFDIEDLRQSWILHRER